MTPADASRHTRQRAGAGAGATGWPSSSAATSRSSRSPRSATGARRRRTSPAGSSELEQRSARRPHRPRRALGQGCPHRARATAWSWWRVPARADARDAICGRGQPGGAPAGGARRHEQPAPGGAAAGGPRRCRGRASCGATSTRGCASWPRGRPTRWCWRWPGCSGSAATARPAASSTSSCPPPGQGALALEARAGARSILGGSTRGRRRRAMSSIAPSGRSSTPSAPRATRRWGPMRRPATACRVRLAGLGRRAGRIRLAARSRSWAIPRISAPNARRRMLRAGAGELLRRAETSRTGDRLSRRCRSGRSRAC